MTKHPKEAERLKKIVESFPKITVTVVGETARLYTFNLTSYLNQQQALGHTMFQMKIQEVPLSC